MINTPTKRHRSMAQPISPDWPFLPLRALMAACALVLGVATMIACFYLGHTIGRQETVSDCVAAMDKGL